MMQPVIDIRPMEVGDIPAILKIQAVCYPEETHESNESLHAKFNASQSTCLIACLEGRVVGYLISVPWELSNPPTLHAETCQLPLSPNCLYLHDLAVTPDARRYGAGRALMDAFLARLRDFGFGRASLIAVHDAVSYWERYGFRVVPLPEPMNARLSTYGESAVYMELES